MKQHIEQIGNLFVLLAMVGALRLQAQPVTFEAGEVGQARSTNLNPR